MSLQFSQFQTLINIFAWCSRRNIHLGAKAQYYQQLCYPGTSRRHKWTKFISCRSTSTKFSTAVQCLHALYVSTAVVCTWVTNTKINISTAVYTAVPTVHLVTKKSMNVTWARAVSVDPENRKSKNLFTPCLLGVLICIPPPDSRKEKFDKDIDGNSLSWLLYTASCNRT